MFEQVPLQGRRFLILIGDDYEDLEVWYPKLRLEEAGAEVFTAGTNGGVTHPGKHGYPCKADVSIADLKERDFDGILLPGGWMPDKLRRDPVTLALIREFDASKKLVAAICHGGWLAISAGIYRGVQVTGSPGIKDDLINAGALWHDAAVVVDRHFVSSRKPGDLPEFCKAMIRVIAAQPPR